MPVKPIIATSLPCLPGVRGIRHVWQRRCSGEGTHADGVVEGFSQPTTGARSAIGCPRVAVVADPWRGKGTWRGKGRWVGAPDNVGGRRPGAAGRLRGSRPAARTGRTGPGADHVLRSRHLRGPAVHRGDLPRSGWSRAPHSRAVIARGLVAGSGAPGDHHPHAVTQGRGRVQPEARTAAQASPQARAGFWACTVTLAVAGMVAAIRLVGSWSRLPGRPRPGFRQLARWWPLGSRINR
jgi:hypothetical protein